MTVESRPFPGSGNGRERAAAYQEKLVVEVCPEKGDTSDGTHQGGFLYTAVIPVGAKDLFDFG